VEQITYLGRILPYSLLTALGSRVYDGMGMEMETKIEVEVERVSYTVHKYLLVSTIFY
jgi:hypothetical protein